MITAAQFNMAPAFRKALDMGWPSTPIYARDPVTGALHQCDGVEEGEIVTRAGQRHTVIVLNVSDVTSEEA